MKIAVCPYCGKRLSYIEAFMNRKKGEYFCNKCGKESNVYFKKSLIIPYIFALLIGISLTLIFIFTKEKAVVFYLFLVLVPFLIFYAVCPYYLKLKPIKKYMDSLYNTNFELQINQKKDENNETYFQSFQQDGESIINTDVFDTIKQERGMVIDSTEEKTKAFSKYEDISSNSRKDENLDKTKRIM